MIDRVPDLGSGYLPLLADINMTLPDNFLGDMVATFAFGLLAILLVVLGFKVFDWLTPKCNFQEEINKGNLSVGMVISAVILGICFIIAHVLSGILHS
jgi:putative membrane protein